jgi:dihydrofolate reductase
MAELTLTTFLTLDGVMQAPGTPNEDTSGHFAQGGWVFPLADADMGRIMVEIFSRADAFLLGRTTYDIFAAHWPRVTDPDDPIAAKLNALPKFVASRTRTHFDWHNTEHLPDVEHHIQALKARFDREVQVHGSCGLAQTLIRHGLVDEYRLLTFPVVLGSGKRLFGEGAVPASYKLMGCTTTASGAIVATYRRGGKLRTGSFALE